MIRMICVLINIKHLKDYTRVMDITMKMFGLCGGLDSELKITL